MARVATGLAVAAGVGAVAAVVRATDRRWRAAADPCGPDALTLPDGKDVKVTTDDGATLAATVGGRGATVVLSHCWAGNRAMWAPVARRLVEQGRRVVLYDHRGHGESTAGSAPLSLERLGADLDAVLAGLDVGDAVVVGHSMGGMAAQVFAAEHTEVARRRVRSMVLVATASRGVAFARLRLLAGPVIASAALERVMRGRAGHALVRGAVGRHPRHAHLLATRDAFVATSGAVRRDLLRAMHTMDLSAGLDRIDVPVTVVCGRRDRLTPPRSSRSLAAAVPGARLVELPDAGHMLPLEAPDELAAVIAEAMAR